MFRFKISLLLSALLSLCGCAQLDDYMLGKDNTPSPKILQPVPNGVNLTKKWSLSSLSRTVVQYNKLQPQIQGQIIYIATNDGIVKAIDRFNGKLIWEKKLATGLVSGPTVNADLIALGTDRASIIVLAAENGKLLWQQKISGDSLAKPIIAKDQVIVKTIDGNTYALNVANGEKIWMSVHGAPALILKASSSPIVVGDRMVLVGFADGKMDALDLHTGHLLWQRAIAYAAGSSDVERLIDISADPIVSDGVAYIVSYQGFIGALSLQDGQLLWRKPASVYKNMVLAKDTLYITDSKDVIWAINKKNGRVRWKQIALKARGLTEPVIMGKNLIIGDQTGLLHVLATRNGNFIGRIQYDDAISLAYVAHNGIYLMTNKGKLSHFAVS